MKGVDTNKYMKNKFDTVNVFLAMSMLGIVVFFSLAPFLRQKALEWLVMENNPKYITTDFQLAELWSQKLGGGLRK